MDLAESPAGVVLDRCPCLACERIRFLRPGVSLGKLDQAVDLRGVSIERRSDQPGKHGAGESTSRELVA